MESKLSLEQLEKELYAAAVEAKVPVLVTRLVVVRWRNEQCEVLLLTRALSSWLGGEEEPPGGKLEEGETLLEAGARELKEETGLAFESLTNLSYLCHIDFENPLGKVLREFHFCGETKEYEVICHPKEHSSHRWVPLKEIYQTELHPTLQSALLARFILAD